MSDSLRPHGLQLPRLALIPGLGRSPGEGKGYPLQYAGLENSMDYSPWGRNELDTTEQLSLAFTSQSICLFFFTVHLESIRADVGHGGPSKWIVSPKTPHRVYMLLSSWEGRHSSKQVIK